MLKTFLIGILLGIAAAAGALYALPVVDQYRPDSLLSVATNGGTRESFHINIPMDRIMVGAPGQARALPDGLQWPNNVATAGMRIEIYKLRNARDEVVGVASRNAVDDDSGGTIDWVIHIPARGSMFFNVRPAVLEDGYRGGSLRAGSREFASLRGTMTERWVAAQAATEGGPSGRLELEARYVGQPPPEPEE